MIMNQPERSVLSLIAPSSWLLCWRKLQWAFCLDETKKTNTYTVAAERVSQKIIIAAWHHVGLFTKI